MRDRVRRGVCSLLAAGWMASAVAAQEDHEWRKIHQDDGILVSTREQPGQALPSFRGQGSVKGPVLHVLAVVLDDARSKEWAKDADLRRQARVSGDVAFTTKPKLGLAMSGEFLESTLEGARAAGGGALEAAGV